MIHQNNYKKYIVPRFNVEQFEFNMANLKFEEKTHKYLLADNPYLQLSSVSQELSHCNRYYARRGQLASKRILQIASLTGKIIHGACEKTIWNEEVDLRSSDFDTIRNRIKPWIEELKKHFEKNDYLKIIMTEVPLVSRKEKLAGTADLILWNDKDKCVEIWDWKSGKYSSYESTKWKYSAQLWGYIMLLKENWKPKNEYQKIKTFVVHMKGNLLIKEQLNYEELWQ